MNVQQRIARTYYVLSGSLSFGGLSFVSAVYTSFLLKHGLSLLQVNVVNAVFFLTLFACEIPTGAFADIFGRKTSFVLACFLIGLGKVMYSMAHGFSGFIVAEIIAGIGFTFYNGAFQSWFIDSMKHHGHGEDFTRELATASAINQPCAGLGAITGSMLFAMDINLPWMVGACLLFCLTIAAMVMMDESYRTERTEFSIKKGAKSMWDIVKKCARYSRNDEAVRFVLIITFVQILASMALNMYWQPFFTGRGIQPAHLGYLFFAMMMCLGAGSHLARSLVNADERKLIVRAQICLGIIVILMAVMPGFWVCAGLFLLHEVPRGFIQPLKDNYLHRRIPSEERATIASFCAIAPHIGGAIGLVLSGFVADRFGIAAAWICSGAVFVGGSLLIALTSKRKIKIGGKIVEAQT
jgi:MFS family permease